MHNIPLIKEVTVSYVDELRALSIQTFTETFTSANKKSDVKLYVENELSRGKLVEELINPNSMFFFIEVEGLAVGYIKLNLAKAQTDVHDDESLEIERIYVRKECHGRNLGRRLLAHALDVARDRKLKYVWLGVWENNSKAIAFYEKHGFTVFGKHQFVLGNDIQTDILMKLSV